ncbi:MAG: response regulator transcription factor [bacterium]|nr:response regulator transcription factor [bacterium]
MTEAIRVLLVEDHEMTRMGLEVGIEKTDGLVLVGQAADGLSGVELAQKLQPDVILMDIGLPEIDGIEATRRIKELELSSKILMFTSREDEEDVFAALSAGADGYVTKGTNITQLASAIEAVNSGASWLDASIARLVLSRATGQSPNKAKNPADFVKSVGLTKRELEVLALISDGMSNSEIADKLVVSLATTKAHVHNILQKLCVKNKTQATIVAVNEGLV